MLKKVVWVIALLGLLVGGAFSYFVYNAVLVPNTAFNNDKAFVYIPTGGTFDEVKAQLDPLLKEMYTFEAVAQQKKYTANVRPGRYTILKGMNNNEIINVLRSQNLPVKVSFNNQETLADLAGRIAAQIEADSLSLLAALNNTEFLSENGFDKDSKLGMYIPNTYEFYWNTNAKKFRDKMLKEYNRFWSEARIAKAEKLNLTIDEVTALASIVQKETVKVDERPRVAGVYLNRLEKGIKLQADPTVIYAIKKKTGNYDTIIKRVLYRDLEIDSPYNTYKNVGLPPGPIAMPDISSIDAVLNAEVHEYLFFVADVSNFGYHKFAKTLAQHNQNKKQYVEWLNSQKISR